MSVRQSLFFVKRTSQAIRRRVLLAAGRPDPAPWVLFPPRRRSRTRETYVDFMFALDYLSPNARLLQLFHEAMGEFGLRMLLVNQHNVHSVTEQVRRGALKPHVYLDLSSRPGDPFGTLLRTAAAAGIYTIMKPADDAWVLKARSHERLAAAGLPLPPTVIFKASDPDRDLTEEERARLGDHCVIKPSFGEAGNGAVIDVLPTRENIATARNFNRDDDWLVQKMMRWGRCGERPAYWRIYNILGRRSIMWWALGKGYQVLSWEELHRHQLLPAIALVDRIAELTGMDYFSSEVAGIDCPQTGQRCWCLIDYINDQCDLDPQESHSGTVPIPFTRWACRQFAEFTWRKKHNLPPQLDRCLFLADDNFSHA